jgi:antitoxin YefM
MRTINFSDARNNLKDVLDRVVADSDVTIITRRDADDVVMMSLSTWNSWKETEYLLASPANARHLRKSIAELNAGKGVERELIEPGSGLRVQEPRATYRSKKTAIARKAKPGSRAR